MVKKGDNIPFLRPSPRPFTLLLPFYAYLVRGLKLWLRCTEAVLDFVSNLQQRLQDDKVHLLEQLEQMCSEEQVRQVMKNTLV